MLWNCAAHQFAFGSGLERFGDALKLRASTRPADVSEVHIRGALETLRDWPETIRQWRELSWSIERLSIEQLGHVHSAIHNTEIRGPISALAKQWAVYLNGAPGDATGHKAMLLTLAAGRPFEHKIVVRDIRGANPAIGDGRHRAFAAYEFGQQKADLTIEVYRGRYR